MDFVTIEVFYYFDYEFQRRLNKDMYRTPTEFVYEMRLIYRNCMRYNIVF